MKPFKNKIAFCYFVTFFFNAIWHGFYLSYYLSFLLLFCYKDACDILLRNGIYKKINQNRILVFIVSMLGGVIFESIGIIFFNLEWDISIVGLKNVYYFPCIIILGLYIINNLLVIFE